MKITILGSLYFSLLLLAAASTTAQNTQLPKLIEKNGRHALLVDGKPFLMLGGQVHNSSAWPGMMPQVWAAATQMHLNTVEIPLYWEQIEPAPGKFNFSFIDTLLNQSRKHKVHLVLLWFATWKNGSNHYMPEWMKRDAAKYPNITGKKGQPVDSPSPHSSATLDADINAFSAVMRYLKKADNLHTVIMVQVENESGTWDSMRDYSLMAQKLFDAPVPAEMLNPGLLQALNVQPGTTGTWLQVFGDRADEYFHAWSVASFIEKVAAAGKKEYAIPMYTNAALRDPLTNPMANTYESGGPTDNVIPIWKVAAPALDLVAPDIYLQGSEKVMKVIDLYDRKDNALFVPEAAITPENAKYMYEVIARGGIGFSPFGIDDNLIGGPKEETVKRLSAYAEEYTVLSAAMTELAQWANEGKIKAVIETEDHAEQTVDLGNWKAIVSFGGKRQGQMPVNEQPIGRAMIVKLSTDEFVVIGSRCHITFNPLGVNAGKAWQYLKVEEGQVINGAFKMLRIRNGDETDWGGPRLGSTPTVLRIIVVAR